MVGWDGYVYPWTFSIHDFEPIAGRIRMPPPSHQTTDGHPDPVAPLEPQLREDALAYSWREDPGSVKRADEDPAGVTSHF